MESALFGALAAFASVMPVAASASELEGANAELAERYRTAMKGARWTGSLLSSNAETLPTGHFYTEPYFYDVITGGNHYPGSSGFYQYGLAERFTVGVQPKFAFGTRRPNREFNVGDLKLLTQFRLTRFTPEKRIPTIAIVAQESLPIGKHDKLGLREDGHGSGSFATEVGVNVQHYFLLRNGRLLRGRINFLKSFPHGADVADRSVYGTQPGFRGRAKPGSKTTMIAAVEYSLAREWVLAFDVIRESTAQTGLKGRYGTGSPIDQTLPARRSIGFAPAVEYSWSDTSGVLLGVWISPKGLSSPSSVVPAIAYSRFW
ncbi:hypothetical protein LZ496_12340 [Sphingomonas sp. NSE70-1]|uniref:MetA-pathway of phenol degradation n=1 Tax=Sphingomonas caseinilyticus TaxID=2908205 RepID=A0ABT0RX34_9SPHN|nr:hypothetical protein [Sphingomonas caseinilyticus]MCL6699568.1 hypothetical protein [Sphingomonas caseinilyticus]